MADLGPDITLPGTSTKLPLVMVLGGGLLVAFLVLMRKGGSAETAEGDTTGVLAAELDQRLKEQWQGMLQLIAELQESGGIGDPTTPPSKPVNPNPPKFPDVEWGRRFLAIVPGSNEITLQPRYSTQPPKLAAQTNPLQAAGVTPLQAAQTNPLQAAGGTPLPATGVTPLKVSAGGSYGLGPELRVM